jgi:fucose 4-O-acetylase-like acetyltransferase
MIAVAARHEDLRNRVIDSGANMFGGKPCKQLRIPWVKALGFWDLVIAVFWWVSAASVMALGAYEWETVGSRMGWVNRWKRFGLGNIDPATSIVPGGGSPNTFPIQVLIANFPQLWFSVGYCFWNNQISRIYMEHEWRQHYTHRQVPRVSYPLREPNDDRVKATRWLQSPI